MCGLHRARDSIGLEGVYPEPVGVYKVDIPANQRLSKTGSSLDLEQASDKPCNVLVLKETRETLSYLDGGEDGKWIGGEEITAEEFAKASEKNVHDLFTLLKYGIVHPDLISMFHDGRSEHA